MPCYFCPICFSCPSRIWQTEQQTHSKSTKRGVNKPWSCCNVLRWFNFPWGRGPRAEFTHLRLIFRRLLMTDSIPRVHVPRWSTTTTTTMTSENADEQKKGLTDERNSRGVMFSSIWVTWRTWKAISPDNMLPTPLRLFLHLNSAATNICRCYVVLLSTSYFLFYSWTFELWRLN